MKRNVRHFPIWIDYPVVYLLTGIRIIGLISFDQLLSLLRILGYSKGFAIRVLEDYLHYDFVKAKLSVHESRTWADRKEEDQASDSLWADAFREAAADKRDDQRGH